MEKIYLSYNPYTKDRCLKIGSEILSPEQTVNIIGPEGRELSEWIDNFFEKIHQYCNDSFDVYFSGIHRDYEFAEDALSKFKNRHTEAEGSGLHADKVVYSKDSLVELKKIFEKMQQETPFEQLKSEEVTNLFKKAVNSEFEMAVVATMSSGKSTLINSILGREILPARNEATTAKIAKIYDIDGAEHFSAKCFRGTGKDKEEIDTADPVTTDDMNRFNDNPDTTEIDIFGDIVGISSNSIRLVLMDTPGTNNSRTMDHYRETMDLLKKDYKPMIIYVLNGTQLETNDDSALLREVSEIIRNGNRQSRDRFIFILNKADEFDADKGETVARKIDDVKKYLSQKHGIDNPRVFPASARLAKQIRQVLSNDPALTSKEKRELNANMGYFIDEPSMHFNQFADFLSPQTKLEFQSKISEVEKNQDEYAMTLFYSGIPSIEYAISEYLSKYAIPAKISEAVSSFKGKIDALNIEAEENCALENNVKELELRASQLSEIKEVLSKGDKAKSLKDAIKSASSEKDRKEKFAQAREKLFGKVQELIGNKAKEKVSPSLAEAYVETINATIPPLFAEFLSEIKKVTNEIFVKQVSSYVEQYRKYVEDLVGDLGYNTPPEAIFGTNARIDLSSAMNCLNEYSQTETIEVFDHYRSTSKWWNPLSWGAKKAVYRTETETFVNFKEFLEDLVQPKIDDFLISVRNETFSKAEKEEEAFKNAFIVKLDEIDSSMKEKIAMQQEILSDQEKLKYMIADNKEKLKWINDFKQSLDSILDI